MEAAEQIQAKIVASESAFVDYWQQIDIIRHFSGETLEGALDQPVRKAIIQILSEGHMVTFDGEERKLRVMNASQLLKRINEMANETPNKYGLEEIKRSNLYYHINALEERGFITEVGLIPKKNRLISYYGRTARVFLLDYGQEHQPELLSDENLPKLVASINPELSGKEIDSIIEGLALMYRKVDTEPITKWIEDHERQLRQSDVDIRHLHNIFHKILAFDSATIEAMRKFASAMNLELD